MTAPGPSGPARPIRLAGLILIGVAVVAIGLGVFSLSSNGSPQASPRPATAAATKPTAAPPTRGTTATTHPTTKPTTGSGAPPTTGFPSGQTTTVAPPPTGGNPGNQPAAPVAAAIAVRIFNNSFIKDLAENAADEIRGAGFNVVFVGNYSQGVIPTTTAYFNPAVPGEQQLANQLGQQFGMKVEPRFQGIFLASPGVIVIVTKDFHGAPTK